MHDTGRRHAELLCKYAHARYLSINSYDASNGVPTDALNDVQTVPDPGSRNPFLPGALRAGNPRRDFTITILNEFPPENPDERLPNTLYAKAGDQGEVALVWRIYVPDKNRDITGGVGLPEPRVTLASGEVLGVEDSYGALSPDPNPFPIMPMDPATYAFLRSGSAYSGDLWPEFPAQNPPVWKKTFNIPDTVNCWYVGVCQENPDYFVAQYANLDNQYMSVLLNRDFGEVLVIRGKAPVTPRTYRRNPFMQGNVDMRYWSITTNESIATTRVVDGLYDEEVPVDREGYYTIVVSLAEDRPRNSRSRNGVAWMEWGEMGDGAGHPNDGHLILRHMLPSPDFENAIQNVEFPGDEESVLGPYMPVFQYMSKEDFEALGRNPGENLP